MKNRTKFSVLWILTLWYFPLLVGCSSLSGSEGIFTSMEENLFVNNNCRLPCWQGIEPGLSSRLETIQILKELKDDGKIATFNCGSGGCALDFDPEVPEGIFLIGFEGEEVDLITGQINFDLSVGELIDITGPPQFVYPIRSGSCSSCNGEQTQADLTSSHNDIPIHFINPEKGTWFLGLTDIFKSGCVCTNIRIIAFEYFSPMSVSETLVFLQSQDKLIGVQESDLQEWKGFGPGY